MSLSGVGSLDAAVSHTCPQSDLGQASVLFCLQRLLL